MMLINTHDELSAYQLKFISINQTDIGRFEAKLCTSEVRNVEDAIQCIMDKWVAFIRMNAYRPTDFHFQIEYSGEGIFDYICNNPEFTRDNLAHELNNISLPLTYYAREIGEYRSHSGKLVLHQSAFPNLHFPT